MEALAFNFEGDAAPMVTSARLRPDYQQPAYHAFYEGSRTARAQLLCMATGLGKTITFCEIARSWPGVVWIIAHRKELISQAAAKVFELTGERPGIEKAETKSHGERIIVGSIQTLRAGRRERLRPPTLIIIDEAHHALAASYRELLNAYPQARVLGVTATPKRGDKRAMGIVFDAHVNEHPLLAMDLDMAWGIENAWLTPFRFYPLKTQIDVSKLDLSAGDAALKAMDDAVSECAREISEAAIQAAGMSRLLAFAPGVKTAHASAEAMNLIEPGTARALDGKTEQSIRELILSGHQGGAFPRLCNCQVLTEGYDDPRLIYGLIAILCKSPGRLVQMLGRVSRLWPGVDRLEMIDERRAAIAASPKPYARILDLVGNNMEGAASIVDVLGGKYTDEERTRAKRKIREEGGDVGEALEAARAEINAAAARAARKRLLVSVGDAIDPFSAFGVRNPERGVFHRPEDYASEKQVNFLRARWGIDPPEKCTKRQFRQLLAVAHKREQKGLCSHRQVRWLASLGIGEANRITVAQGKQIADAYRAAGKVIPHRAVIDAIIGRATANGGAAT